MMSDIHQRLMELDKARRKKQEELMEEYDVTVYWPAKRQLIADCEKEGHIKGHFHDNGLGWTWWYCGKCGVSFDKKKYFE